MQEPNLNDTIDRVKSFTDSVHKAVEDMEKYATTEAEKSEANEVKDSAAVKLYNAISDATIDILNQPSVKKIFEEFGAKIGKDFSVRLIELLAITMSHSAVHTIITYDNLLKDDISKHDKQIYEALNMLLADDNAHYMAIKEIRNEIAEIRNDIATIKQ